MRTVKKQLSGFDDKVKHLLLVLLLKLDLQKTQLF